MNRWKSRLVDGSQNVLQLQGGKCSVEAMSVPTALLQSLDRFHLLVDFIQKSREFPAVGGCIVAGW